MHVTKSDWHTVTVQRYRQKAVEMAGVAVLGEIFSWLFLPDRDCIFPECNHMAHILMDTRGIPVSSENTEVIAYLADHLVNQVKEAFAKPGMTETA